MWEEFGGGPNFPPVKFFLISMKFGELEPETALQAQIQTYGLTFPVIINPTAYQLYEVNAVPALYLVDTAATICGIHVGAGPPPEELKNAIREELYACGASQPPMLGEWAAVAQILFGVSGDAGGFVIVGGKLKKIPPWDPLRRLGSSGRDVLRALAAAELASGLEDEHLRDDLRSSALKSVVEATRKLQSSKHTEVGASARHGTPRTLGPSSSAADM